VAQLKSYDDAFAAFFDRLARDGIDRSNTLFVFTVDEGDHFVGGTPTPATCDGVTTPCDWTGQVGEINANIRTLMTQQHPEIPTVFTVHGDDAPTFYLSNNPGQNDPATRAFERAASTLTAVNPYTGHTDTLMQAMADQAEQRLLHMYTTGDPLRNPTFTYFADPNYFLTDFPATTCTTCIGPAFAWNHGDIQPEIANTWLGLAGPGVRNLGETGSVWTDHTDVRPTMLTLLGLRDSYADDGRAILEVLHPSAVASSVQAHRATLLRLGAAYKQLNAPFGALGMASLAISTRAVTGGTSTDDTAYQATQAQLVAWANQRDQLASAIAGLLADAQSGDHALDEGQAKSLIAQADALVAQVKAAAGQ
jgi:arylsulfatase A-like enzyme